ncbi:MAG: acyl carrier protein [Candidatus Sericytochromatia bacterium]|nr:acyl carrier protein [Candidatus Tanganyikabacteria bacterium]MEB3203684.1 acyl carrier protein [Candidatus Sericytochromatia bacterium]MEB3236790.1 acyl carrier protein [Candidatus Sericytochromatia bacterium]
MSETGTVSGQELFERIRAIVVEKLGVTADVVTLEASFQEDLGADSLDTVELVMAVEEAFDLQIPDEAAEGLTTVAAVVSYVEANKA